MKQTLSTTVSIAALSLACASSCTNSSHTDGATAPDAQPTASNKLLHCGDFMSAAELTTLGFDASSFQPDKEQNAVNGPLLCNFAGWGFTLFPSSSYSSIVDGAHEATAQGKLTAATGPTIGRSSEWTVSSGQNTCMLLSTDGRFAGVVNAKGQELAEKLARAVDANISKLP